MHKSQLFYPLKHTTVNNTLLGLKGSTLKVFLALTTFADFKTGHCWPSRKLLRKMVGITSSKRLQQALDELVVAELIDMWDNEGRTEYQLR